MPFPADPQVSSISPRPCKEGIFPAGCEVV
jgi:hypothetical protein